MSPRQQLIAWVAAVTIAITAAVVLVATGSEPYPPTPTPTPSVVMTDRTTERASRGDVRDVCNLRTCHRAPKSSHTPVVSAAGKDEASSDRPHGRSRVDVASSPAGVWARIAKCESGGRLHADSHAGGQHVHGLYQLDAGWYQHFGINPWKATAAEQLRIARYVLDRQGWRAWPYCSRVAGVR